MNQIIAMSVSEMPKASTMAVLIVIVGIRARPAPKLIGWYARWHTSRTSISMHIIAVTLIDRLKEQIR